MNAATRTELETLITAVLERETTSEQTARLEEMLRGDWECRRFYLEALDLHARLLQTPAIASGKLITPPLRRFRWPRWWPLAVAAGVAVLVGPAAYFHGSAGRRPLAVPAPAISSEQTAAGCAVLAQVHGENGLIAGSILMPGKFLLPAGLARIDFFSGATLLLEGPSDLDIRSAWEVECHQGKARVRVPPPARGFKLLAPGMTLVDLGTEFGLNVSESRGAEVRVFEGEVEAHPAASAMRRLTTGMSLRSGRGVETESAAADFTSIDKLNDLSAAQHSARYEAWQEWSRQARQDPRLIAYYDFKHTEESGWDRYVHNLAEPANTQRTGAAVGARWAQGRWPMKDALEFKGPGDRVRLDLGADLYSAITLTCWVCVEGLDRKYNALLLTDGYDPGEPHWQIYEDGRLMFSIAYPDPAHPEDLQKKLNQIYYSPSIFNLANQRRWHQLAVTYENQTGTAIQYLDGREISREVSAYHQPGRPISFGPAEIGNWGLPTEGHRFPIRNLNGRIDEFAIYHAVLSAGEIARAYDAGRPE